ncbi:uncharacterized protein TRAVEDRAFT_27983 [Trametes versicolor FP-101664 SS1]|uniref:uncharacterized protein n=1 Tax=Trametes versicolor (strain FP-101664) TaxID=717944 RepID=UPI0004622F06|nr:uncharacterized protein TRAVEDRAFT_27983 [Trametes versicolor FP-101664 SS1]EIW60385.1 hypothetical protein TRAVEDRAFT_27983 [Trametes versicolor FP-101664 SS1]
MRTRYVHGTTAVVPVCVLSLSRAKRRVRAYVILESCSATHLLLVSAPAHSHWSLAAASQP